MRLKDGVRGQAHRDGGQRGLDAQSGADRDLRRRCRYASHERGASLTWAAAIKKWTSPMVRLEKDLEATGDSVTVASDLEELGV